MKTLTGQGLTKWMLILLVGVSLAACGQRRTTTVTTTTTTFTPVEQTASGVQGVSASGVADKTAAADPANATATATDAASGAPIDPQAKFRTRGKLMLAGVGSALLYEGATGAGYGATGSGPLLAGGTGAQCANPFGGAAALGGQSICADTGERLACDCTDDGCQLFRTGLMSCSPVGAVVN